MRTTVLRPARGASVCLALAAMIGAGTLAAQTPEAPQKSSTSSSPAQAAAVTSAPVAALPSARSILDRHLKAIGGRKAVLAHTSSHATGIISVPAAGITGTIEVFAAAKPNRALLKITLGGVGEVMEGYDGANAWSMSPMTGPMVLSGKQLEDRKFDAEFYGELHDSDRYDSMKTVEKTVFEGRPCYKVSLVRRGGGEDIEFYDVETGLKAGGILTRESPMGMGSITTTSVESDYKRFGDVLQPTTLKQSAMGIQQVFTISTLEYDKVDASVFDPPAQIKALVK